HFRCRITFGSRKPNSALCPGDKFPFQLAFVAVYGLLPLRVAFQLLVMRLSPEYCQVKVQLLRAAVVSFVTLMLAVNPLPHWLVTVYSHAACAGNTIAEAAIASTSAGAVRPHNRLRKLLVMFMVGSISRIILLACS